LVASDVEQRGDSTVEGSERSSTRAWGLKTIHNALSILRRAFNLLQREGLVDRNPAAHIGELLGRVKRRTATEARVIDAWTSDEAATLLRLAQKHAPGFFPALATLFYTGMRRGEVLRLQWCDVDFTSRQIHVRRTIVKSRLTTPKIGHDRQVFMAPARWPR
jgi:integrase